MMKKIPTRDVREYVMAREAFDAGNIYAKKFASPHGDEWIRYVVYSYGDHYPMYVYENGVWYQNNDRVSMTTSKHMGLARPIHHTMPMTTEDMKRLAQFGIAGVAVGMDVCSLIG